MSDGGSSCCALDLDSGHNSQQGFVGCNELAGGGCENLAHLNVRSSGSNAHTHSSASSTHREFLDHLCSRHNSSRGGSADSSLLPSYVCTPQLGLQQAQQQFQQTALQLCLDEPGKLRGSRYSVSVQGNSEKSAVCAGIGSKQCGSIRGNSLQGDSKQGDSGVLQDSVQGLSGCSTVCGMCFEDDGGATRLYIMCAQVVC